MDPADLPPIHDVVLAPAEVEQLFVDVAAAAELVGVSYKGAPAARATDAAAGADAGDELARARRAFLAREVIGVQLRYRHGGEEWWDTLMHVGDAVRLVRISHTRALAATPRD